MRRFFRLAAMLSGFLTFPSHAADTDPCPVIAIAPSIVEHAKFASDGGWKRADALAFSSFAYSLEAKASQAVYGQLTNPQCRIVRVKGVNPDGPMVELEKPKGDAADLFNLLATPQGQLENRLGSLWDRGADGLRKMAMLYFSHAGAQRAIQAIAVRKLSDAWMNSKMTDGYAAFDKAIQDRVAIIEAVRKDPELQHMERTLLFQSAQHVDRWYRSSIPDTLYNILDDTKKPD